MKKVYLVFGGESTGTHLVTEILVKAGIKKGTDSWDNIKPDKVKIDDFPIVYRRSFPHENEWSNLHDLLKPLFDKNMITKDDIAVIVTIRDWSIAIESSVLRNHSQSKEEALTRLQRAYKEILKQLDEIDYFMFSYDECCKSPKVSINNLYKFIDITIEDKIMDQISNKILDENIKYSFYNVKAENLRKIEGVDLL